MLIAWLLLALCRPAHCTGMTFIFQHLSDIFFFFFFFFFFFGGGGGEMF